MNDDHADDNLLIARAFARDADPLAASMTDFDGDGGDWVAELASGAPLALRIPWRSGPITERPEVRGAVVELYDEACRRLGIEPRPHV